MFERRTSLKRLKHARRPWRFRSRLSHEVITCSYHVPYCYHVCGHVPPNRDSPPFRATVGAAGPGLIVGNFLATFPHSPSTRNPIKGIGVVRSSHAAALRHSARSCDGALTLEPNLCTPPPPPSRRPEYALLYAIRARTAYGLRRAPSWRRYWNFPAALFSSTAAVAVPFRDRSY